jgi:hypothetical protein
MKKSLYLSLIIFSISVGIFPLKELLAFCGFYVARADASLFNKASRVVLVRNGERTVISMMNDYKGELKDFALVVPVPVVLEKDQIHIGDSKVIDHIDAYTAPRLVEYFDSDPCRRYEEYEDDVKAEKNVPAATASEVQRSPKDLGVKIEASYTIGEYDILILSAKFSTGLEDWLKQNGYKIPTGAHEALAPYIKSQMKFFVAKVNLKNQKQTGLNFLRPLQFAFESQKFMLPIRLGMINSDGAQDLLIYVLTENGRVESTNYRTVKLPSDMEVPGFVKQEFAKFYTSMFDEQVRKENRKAVFTEYFWNMSWCDPCAADPMTNEELAGLGVYWLNAGPNKSFFKQNPSGGSGAVMVTRLHVRYTNSTFPEDLVFQETKDQANFQGRYIIYHPWTGSENQCSAAKEYYKELKNREEARAQNLASLTGWDIGDIRKKMGGDNVKLKSSEEDKDSTKKEKWWKKIWK